MQYACSTIIFILGLAISAYGVSQDNIPLTIYGFMYVFIAFSLLQWYERILQWK